MNRQLFKALLLISTVGLVSSFSSRPTRKQTTRRGRREASSPLTTRRVFGFTLAGGAHKMFSTMCRPVNEKVASSASSSSTSLNYRMSNEFEEHYHMDLLWQSAMYELREDINMTTESPSCQAEVPELQNNVEKQKSKTKDSELVETAKAFLPVAIEIGLIASVTSGQSL